MRTKKKTPPPAPLPGPDRIPAPPPDLVDYLRTVHAAGFSAFLFLFEDDTPPGHRPAYAILFADDTICDAGDAGRQVFAELVAAERKRARAAEETPA